MSPRSEREKRFEGGGKEEASRTATPATAIAAAARGEVARAPELRTLVVMDRDSRRIAITV
jgi:hypothetical protein